MTHQSYSYDEEVAARYDAAVPLQEHELEFYLELAREAESRAARSASGGAGRMLEVTCGTGRVAIPLAQAGVRIVGLDNSAAMLDVARKRSAGLPNAEWVEGDMCVFDLREQFGLITVPIGSFQLMLSVEDQLATLRCVRKHLAPDGRFAFEVENPQASLIAEWLTTKRGVYNRIPNRDYTHPATGRRVVSWGTLQYHPSEQYYTSHGYTEELDNDGTVVQRSYGRPMTVRYFYRYEMEHLLARAGLAVEALYGDLGKGAYRATSPDLIFVTRAAAD